MRAREGRREGGREGGREGEGGGASERVCMHACVCIIN